MGTREAYEVNSEVTKLQINYKTPKVALVSLLDTGNLEALTAKMSQRQHLLETVKVWW